MKQNDSNVISKYEAAVWMARAVSADGVLSPREMIFLEKFANKFGFDNNLLVGMAQTLAEELTPEVICLGEEYIKGYEFEKFVVGNICSDRQDTPFSVISWRGDKGVNGIFATEDTKPDLRVRCNKFIPYRDFYLECKYRSSIISLSLLKRGQLYRHADISKTDKILAFMIVGLGGTPSSPKHLYIVPLWEWFKKQPDFERYRHIDGSIDDFLYNVICGYISELEKISK